MPVHWFTSEKTLSPLNQSISTDWISENYFELSNQLIFTEVISATRRTHSNLFLAAWISSISLIIIRFRPNPTQTVSSNFTSPHNIRGLSGKYRAYISISALALFFIVGWVASFKVIPTWLNNTVLAMFPLLKTVLELTFRDGLEYARRIIVNRRFVIESLSFEWFFELWKQLKVTGGYVTTVRRLSKQCDTLFTQKLLHKIRWMRWRVIPNSIFRVENKIWCKFADLVFQSFLTITKSAELKNIFVNKDTLRMNYTSGRCQQTTDRFVRLYCRRSCPAEVARTLARRYKGRPDTFRTDLVHK